MTRPPNPVDALRIAANEIANYTGPVLAAEILADEFGVYSVEELRASQLMNAIDMMHEAAAALERQASTSPQHVISFQGPAPDGGPAGDLAPQDNHGETE